MDDDYVLGVVPRRLRIRLGLISAPGGALVVLGALTVMMLTSGVRMSGAGWVVLAAVASALGVGVVLGRRALTPEDRAVVQDSLRRVLPPLDVPTGASDHASDAVRDLGPSGVPDGLPSGIPDGLPGERVGDPPRAATTSLSPTGAGALVVTLRPGPVNRRRLVGAPPESSVLVADAAGLRVPAWLLERRPPGLAAADVVVLRWDTIRRWRVRADSDGPDVWALECVPSAGTSGRWWVRRGEVVDEVAVLDHARAVGRVTVELEASVRRGPSG